MENKTDLVDGLQYCLVRCNNKSLHTGFVKYRKGTEVTLVNARRLWRWYATSLPSLATDGTPDSARCKFTSEIEEITVLDAYEVIPCTQKAIDSLRAVQDWIIESGLEDEGGDVSQGTKIQPDSVDGLLYCIIRSYKNEVHAGFIKDRKGTEVTLVNARKLWCWYGGASLSGLAKDGTTAPGKCRFSSEMAEIIVIGTCEIIPCTQKAIDSLRSVQDWAVEYDIEEKARGEGAENNIVSGMGGKSRKDLLTDIDMAIRNEKKVTRNLCIAVILMAGIVLFRLVLVSGI